MRTSAFPVPVDLPDEQTQPLADLVIKVVTPMFGGGVEAGVNDKDHLIRASSIRGHLRFWWRACVAASYKDDPGGLTAAQKLYRDEEKWWGSAAKPGQKRSGQGAIGIRSWVTKAGATFAHDQGPRYITFPFQQDNISGSSGVEFRVRLVLAPQTNPDPDLQIFAKVAARRALSTWILFGGIGARTRRGCGALYCSRDGGLKPGILPASLFQYDANVGEVGTWIAQVVEREVGSGADVLKIPRLHGRAILGKDLRAPKSHIQAWTASVEPLSTFTQAPGKGRNAPPAGGNRPGQSFWPEIGAVRSLFNLPPGRHYKMPAGTASGNEFPRADLGLPRQIRDGNRQLDSLAIVERNDEEASRMASPIILKPVAVSATQSVPVALLLNAPRLWDTAGNNIKVKMKDHGDKVLRLSAIHQPAPVAGGPALVSRPTWPPFGGATQPPRVKTQGNARSARGSFMEFVKSLGWELVR